MTTPTIQSIMRILYELTKDEFGSTTVRWIEKDRSFKESMSIAAQTLNLDSVVAEYEGHISLRVGWLKLSENPQVRECMIQVLMSWNNDEKRIVHYGIDENTVTINKRLLLTADVETIIDHYIRVRDTIIRQLIDLERIIARCGGE